MNSQRFSRLSPVYAGILLGFGALSGCDNSCQQVCDRMADYATDCGISISADEVEACKDKQAGSESREDRGTCRDVNSRREIEAEWTCDDLNAYWLDQQVTESAE
jgi:hypothetical protein